MSDFEIGVNLMIDALKNSIQGFQCITNILLVLTGIFSILSIIVSYFRGTLRFVGLAASLFLGFLLMLYLDYIHINFKRKNNRKNNNNKK